MQWKIGVTETLGSVSSKKDLRQPLTILRKILELLNKLKYFGSYIDCNLNFSENTDYIFKAFN